MFQCPGPLGGRGYILQHRDVVTLEQYPPDSFPCPLFLLDLVCVIHDNVHVLIKPDNVALDAGVNVLVQPHLHT